MSPEDSTEKEFDATLSASCNSPIVAAVKRYMAMIESGTDPTPDQFCLEYPDIADELKQCLAGLVLVENGFGRERPADVPNSIPIPMSFDADIPAALGDFRIVRELGRGGMGIVYEALQLSLGRRVALKVLSFAGGLDTIRLQRFRNEAQAAAQLHHTHIVPVYAVGVDRGVHYYAMQLIDGRSLAQVIDSARLAKQTKTTKEQKSSDTKSNSSTLETKNLDATQSINSRSGRNRYFKNAARMMVQAASALAHAHLYGVVHRDIKPANLMLDPIGNIWITDFGLAQIQSDSNLTRSGDMLGTLRYMSPEQSSGGKTPMDHRTDIYSLGITFYELLTLRPAISGTGYQEIVNQIADEDPISPRGIDPSIPFELEIIMRKAIAKNPVDRYETAELMAEDLQRWLDDKPILARPPTVLQRFAKWRRRHSSLVAVAMIFATLAALGLVVTTIVVFSEQLKTAKALEKEKQQRAIAEISFQQARRAVDTFSELSETELANRPDLKALRREFLQASLDFYQNFIELRGDEPSLQNELSAGKQRVGKIVDALTRLDRLDPLRLLSYPSIQKELGISREDAADIQNTLDKVEFSKNEMPVDDADSTRAAELLTQFESLAEKLNESQWRRLREVYRQLKLPFTFKSIEIVQTLGLTQSQRREIGLIIEQERPDRKAEREGMSGPSKPRFDGGPGKSGFQFEPPPALDRFNEGPRSGRGRRGPPPNDRGPGRDRDFDHNLFSSQTARTVERIISILTPHQQTLWQELVGKAFRLEDF